MDPNYSSSFVPGKGAESSSNQTPLGGDWKKYFTLAIFGLVLVAVGGFLYTWVSQPLVVTVTGLGEVEAPASSVALSFALSAEDATPNGASTTAKTNAQGLRNLLEGKGVPQANIVESQVTITPLQALNPNLSGYQASLSMGAKLSNVSEVGGLISELYSNGASLVSQPIITADDQDALSQQAFDAALKDAKDQANKIGTKNWKFIRKIAAIGQAQDVSSAATTKSSDSGSKFDTGVVSDKFKVSRIVSVTYRMW